MSHTHATRRQFLGGLSFVSLSLAMPQFLMRAATAQANSGKILVVLEMSGGNDGLNTVIPITDAAYAKARPGIAIKAADAVKISDKISLHPSLKPLGAMFEAGQVAVVPGAGYPKPNRSHFESMDIWQTGSPTLSNSERTGWMARYFDSQGHLKSDPLSGVTLGATLPLALWKEASPVSVIGNASEFGFHNRANDRDKQTAALRELYGQGAVASGPGEFVRSIGSETFQSSDKVREAIKKYDAKAGDTAGYPRYNGLGESLQTVARLITGGIPTRIYYVSIGGFDTHANQPWQHGHLLQQTADAVAAFFRDLKLQGRDKDVLLMTFSEFGRRVQENGSNGTDHGAAGPMFVVGPGVKGGIHSDYPSLEDLDDGDLKHTVDFRSVYATVLEKWLRTESAPILGGEFAPLGIL
jgi:uncharacterized protein (DUF1501 family)